MCFLHPIVQCHYYAYLGHLTQQSTYARVHDTHTHTKKPFPLPHLAL
jgi:hypothetical protein